MLLLLARLALAAIFAVAGVAKLLDREGTRETLVQFGLPSRLAPGAAFALPAVELVAAGLLVPAATARAGAVLALALLLVFLVAIGRSLARGEQPDCNCFGAIHSEPIGRWILVRNLGLGAVAVALVATGPGEGLAGALDGGTVFAVAAALAGVLLLGLTWFTWELFRQNGRLLTRVRALEETTGAPPTFTLPGPPDKIGGLALGDLVPDLTLATPNGGFQSLRELATSSATPVALVFTSPGCTGCDQLTDRMPALRDELGGALEPVLLVNGHGPHVAATAERGLSVLVQEDREAIFAFAVGAVPAAVVVDGEGRIASPTAMGPDAVEELLLGRKAVPELNVIETVGGVR
jgi:uncharacterized membrane protein YphA (DoxX/SURF4 family)